MSRPLFLMGVLLLVVAGAIAFNYRTYFIEQDYVVLDYVSCDPESESCFVADCEDGDEECDDTPYKKVEKRAWQVPACARDGEACPELSCEPGEDACVTTTCSEEVLEEGETCSAPEDTDDGVVEEPANASPGEGDA